MAPVYATPAELAEWLGLDEPPVGAVTALRDASLAIDGLLIGAVYETDTDGKPTDQHVIDTLRDATCAQATFKPKGSNTPSDPGGKLASVKVDKVSKTYAVSPTTGAVVEETYSSQAVSILRIEGLIPAHPRVV
ncbi:hypothetical protein [Nocardiopsis tropica]|uniref:Head-to-tail adaptor n=1 Tax=Nocardiopsis tropica TaxID=109330 RepID=A0ABU7KQW9_9ACTN|nr:hypothetical protein [Nocardiopsis umidischolae]MEE2051695.1 hypothetical protein [Nocardiopsis umidischolae]